ncbi:MAG: BLUF domain-containing protein [Alphaproteobacteria bacterium]|nr:BLUF domain-containing protein [Alphaproteobacteria bacterium]
MYLTRLIYFSERNPSVDCDIQQILESARRRNAANSITGALWFNGSLFLQVLEGGRHNVSETYHMIARDHRHQNIELVECKAISERAFPKWSMGYHGDTKLNRERLLRFSGHDQLAPQEMSPESMLGLLMSLDLSDQAV